MYMLPAVVDPSALQQFCERVVDGISAVFLALKRRPIIRYSRTSDIAKRIAHEASVSTPTVSFFFLMLFFVAYQVLLLGLLPLLLEVECVVDFGYFRLEK